MGKRTGGSQSCPRSPIHCCQSSIFWCVTFKKEKKQRKNKANILTLHEWPGMTVLDIYSAVVDALGMEGVYVILDNHTRFFFHYNYFFLSFFLFCFFFTLINGEMFSDGGWCCLPSDGNGLWFNRNYTEEVFFRHWELMVDRHKVFYSLTISLFFVLFSFFLFFVLFFFFFKYEKMFLNLTR